MGENLWVTHKHAAHAIALGAAITERRDPRGRAQYDTAVSQNHEQHRLMRHGLAIQSIKTSIIIDAKAVFSFMDWKEGNACTFVEPSTLRIVAIHHARSHPLQPALVISIVA